MILYVARHGETDLNIDDRYQGISDLPLNTRGRAQADGLASRLPAGITHVIASPQKRAHETAMAVASARGLPMTTMAEFCERDFGIFEGLSSSEVQERFPDLWAMGITQQWDGAPPGGETTREVVQRVACGLHALRELHPSSTLLLVAHGFVVRAVRYLLTGISENEFFVAPKIGNGEYVTYMLTQPAR